MQELVISIGEQYWMLLISDRAIDKCLLFVVTESERGGTVMCLEK